MGEDSLGGFPMDRELWSAHERRITHLEKGLSEMNHVIAKLEGAVVHNTSMTESIAKDTREIRDLVRGAKALGSVALWVSGLVGVPLGVYMLISYIR